MGNNAVVVVLTDGLGEITRNSEEFCKKLEEQISAAYCGPSAQKYWDVPAGCHCNPASVLSCAHADVTQLVAVGGNTGIVLMRAMHLPSGHTPEGRLALLKEWARQEGYTLRKIPER